MTSREDLVLRLRQAREIGIDAKNSLYHVITMPKGINEWGTSEEELDRAGLINVHIDYKAEKPCAVFHHSATGTSVRIGLERLNKYDVVEIYGTGRYAARVEIERFFTSKGFGLRELISHERGI